MAFHFVSPSAPFSLSLTILTPSQTLVDGPSLRSKSFRPLPPSMVSLRRPNPAPAESPPLPPDIDILRSRSNISSSAFLLSTSTARASIRSVLEVCPSSLISRGASTCCVLRSLCRRRRTSSSRFARSCSDAASRFRRRPISYPRGCC